MSLCLPTPDEGKTLVVHTGVGDKLKILLAFLEQEGFDVSIEEDSRIYQYGDEACCSVKILGYGLKVVGYCERAFYEKEPECWQIVEFEDLIVPYDDENIPEEFLNLI